MPTLKKIVRAKVSAKVKAAVTPARLRMAEQTLKAVKAAVPKKTQKAFKAGASKLKKLAKKL